MQSRLALLAAVAALLAACDAPSSPARVPAVPTPAPSPPVDFPNPTVLPPAIPPSAWQAQQAVHEQLEWIS